MEGGGHVAFLNVGHQVTSILMNKLTSLIIDRVRFPDCLMVTDPQCGDTQPGAVRRNAVDQNTAIINHIAPLVTHRESRV